MHALEMSQMLMIAYHIAEIIIPLMALVGLFMLALIED